MLAFWKELWIYRELLISWVGRDIKVRYKQSFLGAAWAILQPLSATLIFTVIFSYFVPVDTGGIPYPIFYYSALLPWTFFSSSVSFGVSSLINNLNLVTKIYFPREILPISSVIASFVDFLVAGLVFVGMMLVYRTPIDVSFLALPLLLVVQVLLTFGIVLIASAMNVFYRDVRFIVPLGLQLWMYLTPIIYPVTLVPERFRPFYMLNPMAGLIDSYRRIILLSQWPQPTYLLTATLVSVSLFAVAYVYFKRVEAVFADII